MKISITKKLGNDEYTFWVEAPKGKDALFMAGVLGGMPTQCGLCNSENVRLVSNLAKEYKFVNVECIGCGAKAQLGEYKAGGYYWKTFEIYAGKATKDAGEIPVVEDGDPGPTEEIPF